MSTFSRRNLLAGGASLAALATTGLTACGNSAEPSGAPGEGSTELRFAWWGSTDRHEMTEQATDAFTAEHPDITVTGEPSDFSGYFDRLATQVAAKDAPDVMTFGGAYVAEYAQREALLDLAEVTDELDLASWMDATAITNGQVEGTQYAATTGVNALAVITNPDVFDQAGVDLPDHTTWTWEEFEELSAEISAKTPEGTFGTTGSFSHDTIDCWARQRGESLYTPDGQLGLTVETLEGLFAVAKRLIDSGAAPSATIITEKDGAPNEQTLMGMGNAAMMPAWSNALGALSEASGSELVLLDMPGESPQPGLWLQSAAYLSISATSEHPHEAALLIDFLLNTPEVGKIWKTDRGVPANAEVRKAIAEELNAAEKAQVDYIDYQGTKELQQVVIGPAGSTAVADITTRAFTEVFFGRATPAEAAAAWLDEAQQAISR